MIKAVLFDLDGTLLDTIDIFWQAFNTGVAMFHLEPVPRVRIMALMNRGEKLHLMMNDVYPGLNIEEGSPILAAMVAEIRKRFNDGGVGLMKGARALLESVKSKGLRLGVVTARSVPQEKVMSELKALNIDHYFDVVMTSAGSKRKPAPDTVFKCVETMGVSCDECIIVGDSNADVVAGRAAGMKTVAVAAGVAFRHELLADSPDFIFSDLPSLMAGLDSVLDGASNKEGSHG